ncbi:hypothetical protein cypCar_00003614, partial [Cyprinus carpio]
AERKGVGVIGVIKCNFLQPTHNKQDFDDTDKYRSCLVEEELEDEEEDQKSYPKPFKCHIYSGGEIQKGLLEENVPDGTQTQERPELTTIMHPDIHQALLCLLESVEEEKSRLSALCHQLRSQLSELVEHSQKGKEEKDDSKLRTLCLNQRRLLVSFIPSLRLEHVDYNSDVIDTILTQVLEHIT